VRRVRLEPLGELHDEIVPYLVVNFIGDEQVRPWVVLKTLLKDAKGEELWKTKYVAGVGEVRPLVGERGGAPRSSRRRRRRSSSSRTWPTPSSSQA